jgi:hypothetical protein
VDVAQQFFTAPTSVGVATGMDFPDALAGGAFLAHSTAPLVLVAAGSLPSVVSTYLTSVKASAATANLFGGTAALSDALQTQVETSLGQ